MPDCGSHIGSTRVPGSAFRLTRKLWAEDPFIQPVAWSSDALVPDLVALGLLTGRVILLRINEVPVYTSSPHPSVLHLNVRSPRPCTTVAFSPGEPSLLATGYDKGRDNSLLVWDIRDAFAARSTGHSTRAHRGSSSASEANFGSRAASHSGSAASQQEQRHILQLGQQESVSAATWLYHTTRTLVAAMAQKWIRVYDLRSASSSASAPANNAVTVMNGRNVTALHADPYDSHRFASLSAEEGVVRLWDLRNATEPLLTFSSEDGVQTPVSSEAKSKVEETRSKPSKGSRISFAAGPSSASLSSITTTGTAHPQQAAHGGTGGIVASMAFSRTRRGHIATMDKESHRISAWNIFEIGSGRPQAQREGEPESGGGALMLQTQEAEEQAPTPTLYYERRSESTHEVLP